MNLSKLLTAFGFAAGAYFAYESGLLSKLTGGAIGAPAPATPAPTPTPTSDAGQQPVNPATPPPTLSLVLQAMKDSNTPVPATFDTYNYFYQQKRGVAGPDPSGILTAATRGELLSPSEWWADMTKAGFNGLGMLARRGSLGCWGAPDNCTKGGYVRQGMGRWIY